MKTNGGNMNIDELLLNLEVMFPDKKITSMVMLDNTTEVYIECRPLAFIRIILNDIGFSATIVDRKHNTLMDTIFIPKPLTYNLQKTVNVMSQICNYVFEDDYGDISQVEINGVGEYVVTSPMGFNSTFIPALVLSSELPKTLSHSYEKYIADVTRQLGPVIVTYDAARNKIQLKMESGSQVSISSDIDGKTDSKILGELLQGMAYWLNAVVSAKV
jgi:hypothetical protein